MTTRITPGRRVLRGGRGPKGLNAYQQALAEGFEGTEVEWLESLKQPALDAAAETVAAIAATNTAAAAAVTAKDQANAARDAANLAAANAGTAVAGLVAAGQGQINAAVASAGTATALANAATGQANTARDAANSKVAEVNALIVTAEDRLGELPNLGVTSAEVTVSGAYPAGAGAGDLPADWSYSLRDDADERVVLDEDGQPALALSAPATTDPFRYVVSATPVAGGMVFDWAIAVSFVADLQTLTLDSDEFDSAAGAGALVGNISGSVWGGVVSWNADDPADQAKLAIAGDAGNGWRLVVGMVAATSPIAGKLRETFRDQHLDTPIEVRDGYVTSVAVRKCQFPGGASNAASVMSDGVVTSATSWSAYFTGRDGLRANSLILDFANTVNNGNDLVVPNAVDVKAVVRIGGQDYPTLFAGVATKALASGGLESTDVLTHPAVAANTRIDIKVYVSVASGGKWPLGRRITNQRDPTNVAGTEFGEGSNRSGFLGAVTPFGSDQTAATTIAPITSSAGAGFGFAPSIVRARMPLATKRWGIVGTSIASGEGDAPRNRIYREEGWCAALLSNAGLPYVSVARSGNAMSAFANGQAEYRKAVLALANLTDVLVEGGTNDAVAASLSQLQSTMVTCWSQLRALASTPRVWGATIPPRTNVGNTAPANGNLGTVIPAYNAWMRDGAPLNAANAAQAVGASGAGIKRMGETGHPLAGMVDANISVRAGSNDTLWGALYVPADGVHPSEAGHTKIATDNAGWSAVA